MSGVPLDADGLRAAGRDLAVPFQVQLADGRLLQMQRLLRLLDALFLSRRTEHESRQSLVELKRAWEARAGA